MITKDANIIQDLCINILNIFKAFFKNILQPSKLRSKDISKFLRDREELEKGIGELLSDECEYEYRGDKCNSSFDKSRLEFKSNNDWRKGSGSR